MRSEKGLGADSLPEAITDFVETVLNCPALRQLSIRLRDTADVGRGIDAVVGEEAVNIFNNLHAGAAALLLEISAYFALVPTLQPQEQAVTHGFSASYIRAASLGDTVSAQATLTHRTGHLAFLSSVLKRGDEVVATAIITKSIVRIAAGS